MRSQAHAFQSLFVNERLNAFPSGFAAEMSPQRVRASKPPLASPSSTVGKVAEADKFLLARMQALVAFAIVLSRKGFLADSAFKWSLVSMGTKVRTEVVCSCEFLGTEMASECGGVLLYSFFSAGTRRSHAVGQVQEIVAGAAGDRRGRRTTRKSAVDGAGG